MGTFDLKFQARSTTANPEAIRARAEELDTLQSRLVGRADDLNADFNSSATHFTDLVGWNIKDAANVDHQQWKDAGVAIVYAASQIEMWAQYVEDFKTERSDQTTEWFDFRTAKEGEIPGKYQDSTITDCYPVREGLPFSAERKCRDLFDDVAEKLDDLEERERINYDKFEENAENISDKLREGPTKENVQDLIDAGVNSWAFYNLDPNHYTMLVDGRELTAENAEEWAGELESYWSGEKPLDDRYHQLMIMMSMINSNAMQAQQGETGYREEEMDFLRTFYEELEGEDPNGLGVLGVPGQMEGDHLTGEEREHALGVLGGGVLALSDHRLGGGYYDLPESVRLAAEGGHLVPGGVPHVERGGSALAQILGNAHGDMEAGYGLSNTLTLAMGLEAENGLAGHGSQLSESEMRQILDVSTRNKDANHDLLTGDYVHPNFDATEQEDDKTTYPNLEINGFDNPQDMINSAIEGMFTNDWSDDGEVASQLTDWIAEDKIDGSPEDQERAGNAAAGFIDTITNPELFAALTGVEDPGGGPDVPVGEINSDISGSVARVFSAYIDDFGIGAQDSSENGFYTDVSTDQYSFAEDGNILLLDETSRVRFMELIMGDDESAAATYAAIEGHNMENLKGALEDEDGDFSSAVTEQGGRLSYLFDSAFDNYSMGLYERGIDEHEKEVEIKKQGWDIVIGAATSPIPHVGGIFGDVGSAAVGPLIESSVDIYDELEDGEEMPSYSKNSYHFDIQLQMLNQRVENGDVRIDDLPDSIIDDEGGVVGATYKADIVGNDPGDMIELLDGHLTGEQSAIAREYSELFDGGYNSFQESNIRSSDIEEYKTHINPHRRS